MTPHGQPLPLPRRSLGTTGLLVGPLCVGCAPLGDMPEAFAYSVAEEQALATYRAILDGPITFLDTAASYGDGESERRLGLVLRERGGIPDGFVVATKADRDLQTGDFSGDQIRRSVERSLRLLGLERCSCAICMTPRRPRSRRRWRRAGRWRRCGGARTRASSRISAWRAARST